MVDMDTGERIRRARELAGLTQEQLAMMVGVSMRTVGNWERGATVPRNRLAVVETVLQLNEGEQRIKIGNTSSGERVEIKADDIGRVPIRDVLRAMQNAMDQLPSEQTPERRAASKAFHRRLDSMSSAATVSIAEFMAGIVDTTGRPLEVRDLDAQGPRLAGGVRRPLDTAAPASNVTSPPRVDIAPDESDAELPRAALKGRRRKEEMFAEQDRHDAVDEPGSDDGA